MSEQFNKLTGGHFHALNCILCILVLMLLKCECKLPLTALPWLAQQHIYFLNLINSRIFTALSPELSEHVLFLLHTYNHTEIWA